MLSPNNVICAGIIIAIVGALGGMALGAIGSYLMFYGLFVMLPLGVFLIVAGLITERVPSRKR